MGRGVGGGGGGHSSRGFSGSSHSSRGFSMGSSGGSRFSSGGSRNSFNSGPRPSMGGRPRPPMGGGGFRPPPPPPMRSYRRTYVHHVGGGVSSLISSVIVLIVLLAFLSVMFSSVGSGSGSITKSTVQRTPLGAQYVNMTDYWQEVRTGQEGYWIQKRSTLERGMENFYKKTGVQPYLYLTGTINGDANPSFQDVQAFAATLYPQLFTDEGHLLVVFQSYDESGTCQVAFEGGAQTKAVLDEEALDILQDYMQYYWYSDIVDESEMFGKIFDDSAERIMTVTKNPWIPVFILAGVIVLVIVLFQVWKARKAQKNREDEATERILNADINRLGGSDDLEDRYR